MEVDASPLYELELIDNATATLILQLQNRDIEELIHASKGKRRDAELSDVDLAVAIYQQELQEMNTILTDRSMGRSFTQAVISDAPLLRESVAEEDAAARDRDFVGTTIVRSAFGLFLSCQLLMKLCFHLDVAVKKFRCRLSSYT